MALTDKLSAIGEAIRAKTGKSDLLTLDEMPAEIASISGSGSGGSAEGCVTVTFMNGDTVLFSRPVYIGDDCPDPITQGHIATPVRASDAQYSYTFYGWGTLDNGAADDAILQDITAGKTVYAIYTATVRSYTITYYDSDGETVLKTESLAYGAKPSYTPQKDNYLFNGWTPDIAIVTGNASYVAIFEESVAFADASWEKIAEIAASGRAKECFAIGDTKNCYSPVDGSLVFTCRIIGFDHDDLADGTGKAPITCALTHVYSSWNNTTDRYINGNYYENTTLRTNIQKMETLEAVAEVASVAKSVNKLCYDSNSTVKNVSDKFWALSLIELGISATVLDGTPYEYYAGLTSSERTLTLLTDTTKVQYYTRTIYNGYASQVSTTGGEAAVPDDNSANSTKAFVHFGFCI